MKIVRYLLAVVLAIAVLLGVTQLVIIMVTFLKTPNSSFAYIFGELIGTLLITVLSGAGATFLFSSAREMDSGADNEDASTPQKD